MGVPMTQSMLCLDHGTFGYYKCMATVMWELYFLGVLHRKFVHS